MIINFPTALYKPAIPSNSLTPWNFTFLVSDTDPPRSNETTTQLPVAVRNRTVQRPTSENYSQLGQRALTLASANAEVLGSGKKHYEVGQIIEFVTAQQQTLNPMLDPGNTEIRHDTNILDLSSLGVSQGDQDRVQLSAAGVLDNLNTQLNDARQGRFNTEILITENQKQQNEASKAISALILLVGADPSFAAMLAQLQSKLTNLVTEQANLVLQANAYAATATMVSNKITALAQLVR